MRWESMEEGIGWEKARWMGIGNRAVGRPQSTDLGNNIVVEEKQYGASEAKRPCEVGELFTYERKYMLSAQVSTSAIIMEGDMVVAELGSGGGRGHETDSYSLHCTKNAEGTVNGEQECSGEHKNPQSLGASHVRVVTLQEQWLEPSQGLVLPTLLMKNEKVRVVTLPGPWLEPKYVLVINALELQGLVLTPGLFRNTNSLQGTHHSN
ncbi:hypothetical protein BD769DRAFT_1639704 [Suillus cothurnatus]|nr:hypothetical protein BD769DRAFT_1639704 [Suillus cothurnatus]